MHVSSFSAFGHHAHGAGSLGTDVHVAAVLHDNFVREAQKSFPHELCHRARYSGHGADACCDARHEHVTDYGRGGLIHLQRLQGTVKTFAPCGITDDLGTGFE